MLGKIEDIPRPKTALAREAPHKVEGPRVRRRRTPRVVMLSWRMRKRGGVRCRARGTARSRPKVMVPQKRETE